MAKAKTIAIIGGSIAGLFAGVLLRRAGYEVDIYERASSALASRGAGITTHDELYDALAQAGIEIERTLAIESLGRVMLDAEGNTIGELDMPQLMTSWGLLYRFLRQQFPDSNYHHGFELCDLTAQGDWLTANFSNGQQLTVDYIIGADGARSAVRSLIMPDVELSYAGYSAWRGLAIERDLPPAVRAQLADRFTLCLPPNEHMLGYMVAGPNDEVGVGQRYYNWVWYQPAASDGRLRDLLTGSDGNYYPLGIPHHLIQPQHIEQMRTAAKLRIAPALRAAISATANIFLQPIHELACPRMRQGRVMLIGDAAFTARPHVGLGVSKAAADAATLAVAMGEPANALDQALDDWQRQRVAFGRAVVSHSARLGCYLEARPKHAPSGSHEHEFYRRPEIVLARIAARHPQQFIDLDEPLRD